jgi:hypothetical protein
MTKTTSKASIRRVEKGQDNKTLARQHTPKASLQGLMQLPLLEAIEAEGGTITPGRAYERIADQLGFDPAALSSRRSCDDGRTYNVFEQQVRWARQTAVLEGLILKERRGI